METQWSFLLVMSVMLVGLIAMIFLVRYIHNRDYDNMELNQPFIVTTESREDVAWRTAQDGFIKCEACGFANFKRVTSCSMCRAAVGETDKERRRNAKSRAKYVAAEDAEAEAAQSVRKLRAERRREWVRKIDVDGKLYWFRDTAAVAATRVLPGFVVHLGLQTEVPPSATVTETLAHETSNLQPEYLTVDSANTNANANVSPLAFAVGEPLVLMDSAVEFLELFAQDFPLKFADFVRRTTLVLAPRKRALLRMKLTRAYAFEQSIEHLACVPATNVRLPINVVFHDHDYLAGGLHDQHDNHRAWFVAINEMLIKRDVGVFTCVNHVDQTFYINAQSEAVLGVDHLNYFYATGRVLGRALLHGDLMAFHLATPLLKILLGQPLSFHDLEHFDPETFRNLSTLLENDHVEALSLDFSVQHTVGDHVETIDLVPNGRAVRVTEANKLEYLTRRTQFQLVECVAPQLAALTKGFYEVVPKELLLMFDAEELDYVLCGSDEIDVDEWERTTRYNQYLYQHPAKRWFFELVREMPMDYKKRLLHFATGSTRVPIGGFSALTTSDGRLAPFTLQSIDLVDSRTIRSFPCFNRIVLPLFIDKKELRANLMGLLAPEHYDHMGE